MALSLCSKTKKKRHSSCVTRLMKMFVLVKASLPVVLFFSLTDSFRWVEREKGVCFSGDRFAIPPKIIN